MLSSFFLEKNMFAFFLNILRQKSGRYVCVQLLQTLNILFENISHETSLCEYSCWFVTVQANWRSFCTIALTVPIPYVLHHSVCRLSALQQPRQFNNCPQVWLLWWGDYGLLHLLLEDFVPEAKQSHSAFFLQWGKMFETFEPSGAQWICTLRSPDCFALLSCPNVWRYLKKIEKRHAC